MCERMNFEFRYQALQCDMRPAQIQSLSEVALSTLSMQPFAGESYQEHYGHSDHLNYRFGAGIFLQCICRLCTITWVRYAVMNFERKRVQAAGHIITY